VRTGLLQVYARLRPLSDASRARAVRLATAAEAAPPTAAAANPDPSAAAAAPPHPFPTMLRAEWGGNRAALYRFSRVFGEQEGQRDVYSAVAGDLVAGACRFAQPSAVVMAYGVTSAGKTYTMEGDAEAGGEGRGVVPRAIEDLFARLEAAEAAGGGSASARPRVLVSAIEIYNEAMRDLLAGVSVDELLGEGEEGQAAVGAGATAAAATTNISARPPVLRLREDPAAGPMHMAVEGAAEVEARTAREAVALHRRAAAARQCAGTGANARSSRGHFVFTVALCRGGNGPGAAAPSRGATTTTTTRSLLHFVDLAGCERVRRTGNAGQRLRESAAINSSLLTLARCLEVLRWNLQQEQRQQGQMMVQQQQQQQGGGGGGAAAGDGAAAGAAGAAAAPQPPNLKVVPYRESRLTTLLRGPLTGHGRLAMLVAASPAADEVDETRRALHYGALAARIAFTGSRLVPPVAAVAAGGAVGGGGNGAMAAAGAAGAEVGQQQQQQQQQLLRARVAELEAALASARAAADAGTARVEELLDEKADLDYDMEVLERKVELLREELVKLELEKAEQADRLAAERRVGEEALRAELAQARAEAGALRVQLLRAVERQMELEEAAKVGTVAVQDAEEAEEEEEEEEQEDGDKAAAAAPPPRHSAPAAVYRARASAAAAQAAGGGGRRQSRKSGPAAAGDARQQPQQQQRKRRRAGGGSAPAAVELAEEQDKPAPARPRRAPLSDANANAAAHAAAPRGKRRQASTAGGGEATAAAAALENAGPQHKAAARRARPAEVKRGRNAAF
jgi:hypothetical protein